MTRWPTDRKVLFQNPKIFGWRLLATPPPQKMLPKSESGIECKCGDDKIGNENALEMHVFPVLTNAIVYSLPAPRPQLVEVGVGREGVSKGACCYQKG